MNFPQYLARLRRSLLTARGIRRSKPCSRRPRVEMLEERTAPAVSILNGGGNGYAGNDVNGGFVPNPPDETGMAGPSSYIEVNNMNINIFSPKSTGTLLATDTINDFFYNPAIGNQTKIDLPFSGNLMPIAASPTGATEAGTTVTITTTVAHGFSAGQMVQVSGVGVAGYNGVFTIATVTATTFTYTDATSGLANSGGGTASVDPGSCGTCDSTGLFDNLMGTNGRFIIGDIDVDGYNGVSQFLFAVSTDSNPTALDKAHWNFYHVTTTGLEAGQGFSDYPGNPGFNADAFVATFDMLNGTTQVVSIKASDIAAGNPLVISGAGQNVFRVDLSDAGGSVYRPTTMHDSVPGDPMWLIQDPNDGTNIRVVKMTNVLTGPTFDGTALDPGTKLALPGPDQFVADGINSPLNPDSSLMNDKAGRRILKAGEFNNTIVATEKAAVGTASVASATVALDGNGNPIGGAGYTAGDTLTLNGGTGTSATLTVQTLGAGGSVATVTVANPGNYTHLSGIDGTVTGGTGSGATFNLVFSGELDALWFAIDVSGGTPAFQLVGGKQNVGLIGFGPNTYVSDPAIDINSSGQIGLGFMESDTVGGAANAATGGFLSTFVNARMPTDAAGTMEGNVLVPAGTGSGNNNLRIGDFSGMNVDPAPLAAAAPLDQSAVEGASHTFNLGTFTDDEGTFWHSNEFGAGGVGFTDIAQFTPSPNGPFKVNVDWGDGSNTSFTQTTTGQIDPGGTNSSHTYGEEKTYTVTVKVTDMTDGKSDSKTFKVTVTDPAVVQASAITITPVEGAAFTGSAFATFTDPGGPEPNASDPGPLANHYKVDSINWGDSTPLDTTSGAISFDGVSTFTVAGSHTYGEEGTFTITAVIDHEGILTTVTATATVSDPAVVATPVPVFAVTCVVKTLTLATFTDPGGPEPNPSDPSGTLVNHYKVDSINWGDATPLDTTTGAITFDGVSTFTVTGKHAYADEGVFTVTVILNHEGVLTTVTTTATIKDDIGLLLLDQTGSKSLMVTGNGVVDVTGCGVVVVDSSDATAAFVTGNGSVIAQDIDVTGGVKTAGHGSFSVPVEKELATADPLGLGLPVPPAPFFAAVNYSGSALLTLNPGTYVGGIKITGNGNVTLNPGVYYMMGGGFSVTGKGSVTGMNVLIVNAPARASDTISITGKGDVTLTGLTSGPDQGLVILQDPLSSNTVQFSGQGNVTLTGVVYVPHALVQITGRANVTINPGAGTAVSPPPILGALIAFDLKVDGNGNLTINPDDPPMKMGMSRIHVLPRSSGLTGAGSASADAGQLRQASLVLLGGQPAGARGPSLTPAALSGPGTTAAIPSVATSLPFRSFAATSVTWSGAGTVGHPDDYWIATGFDPLSERFWNDPVAG